MRFVAIGTWDPERRNDVYKKRIKEGRQIPEGVTLVNEWMDAAGGRQIILFESENAAAIFQSSNAWNHVIKYDCFPVLEVVDDKGTQMV